MAHLGFGDIPHDDERIALRIEVLLGHALNVFFGHALNPLRVLAEIVESQSEILHLRQDLRSFALDAIEKAEPLDDAVHFIPDKELEAHYASAYGIFAGKADHVAMLRFTPQRSRWIVKERWHPEQKLEVDRDGGCTLAIPYHESHELVMDILRHGHEVEVLAPPELRAQVANALRKAAAQY